MNAPEYREPMESFLDTGDGKIHFLDWGGSGPQVHLLHANGFCAGTYAPFVKHLNNDLHISASDLRGHGDSDQSNLYGISDWHIFADDFKLLIEETMAPPIIGMGHSLGVVTAYITAAKYPSLFSAIVLIDPSILPRRRLWWFAVLKIIGLAGNRQLAQGNNRGE
jgi:pimeloyl-ACP methyl ester carboxylesterase